MLETELVVAPELHGESAQRTWCVLSTQGAQGNLLDAPDRRADWAWYDWAMTRLGDLWSVLLQTAPSAFSEILCLCGLHDAAERSFIEPVPEESTGTRRCHY